MIISEDWIKTAALGGERPFLCVIWSDRRCYSLLDLFFPMFLLQHIVLFLYLPIKLQLTLLGCGICFFI